MNRIVLTGRWARDIEFKPLDSGKCVSKTAIAVDDGYGDKKKTYFFNVEAWGKLAESVANHSAKGRKVLVDGRLVMDTWGEGDNKRSAPKIVAENIEFLDYKEGGGARDNQDPFQDDGRPIDISDDDLPF